MVVVVAVVLRGCCINCCAVTDNQLARKPSVLCACVRYEPIGE